MGDFMTGFMLVEMTISQKNSHGTGMGVSKNSGTPTSSILMGFSMIINHPFWGTPIFGNTRISTNMELVDFHGFHVGKYTYQSHGLFGFGISMHSKFVESYLKTPSLCNSPHLDFRHVFHWRFLEILIWLGKKIEP